ncbi:MAG TPA: cytochrome P450 [Methylomirabilota bacterium]|nr:cytochrome P450 [Methylomirabilota bacterium]
MLPPGPKGHVLVGSLPEFRRDILGFFAACARQYGDVVPLRVPRRRLILLSHPDLIEEVLTTHARRTTKTVLIQTLRPVLGDGLLLSEGEHWLRQRRLIQPAFHRQRIAAYGDVMAAYADRAMARWNDGETRDVHADMMTITQAIVAKTLFDADVSGDSWDVGQALHVLMEDFARRRTRLFELPSFVPTPGRRSARRAVERLDRTVYGIIAARRAGGEDRGDLLSLLLHAQDADDGSRMTDRQVRDEIMTLFLAGHETTAVSLSWTWYLLAQHPEVEARLAGELRHVLDGRLPTVADLPRLRYTEMVVTESMRLYPPVYSMTRRVAESCEVGGHTIAPETVLVMSQWVVHRDPRWFDEPAAFQPDRWENDLAKRLPRYAYFPFGGGPRLCIGNTFATMEATLLLATIAQRFRFSPAPGTSVKPMLSVTLRPAEGIPMILSAR